MERGSWAVLAGLLVVGLLVRLPGTLASSLWFDEVYGATFANLGLRDTLIAALRFDIHPPLYYLQLSIWGKLGSSDAWLYANSVAFSLGAIAALYLATVRFFDRRTAAMAAGLLVISPSDLLYAHSVRMYAMVIFLSILCWICNHRLAHGWRGWRATLAIFACALLLTYSHALGFFMASFFGLYALLEMRWVRRETGATTSAGSPILRWCAHYFPLGLLMLPAAGNALVRSTAHAERPDLARVVDDMTFFVAGPEAIGTALGRALAAMATLALIATAIRVRRSRPIILGVIAAPIAVMLVASYVLEPMWNRRSLAFVQPFVGLALSMGLLAFSAAPVQQSNPAGQTPLRGGRVFPIAACVALALAVFGWLHITRAAKEQDFRAAVATIRTQLPAGGTVFVPQFVDFWAINRYLVGPEWGSPLVVQANERSDRWDSILAKLGPERCAQLGLIGETTRSGNQKYDVVIGPIFDPSVIQKRPVLLVHSKELPPEHLARLDMFTPSGTTSGLLFGKLRP